MEKHRWVFTLLNILAAIAIWVAIIVLNERCDDRKSQKERDIKITDKIFNSRYILIDDSSCVHLPDCPTIRVRYHEGVRVKYIDTVDIRRENIEWFCPICIKEKEYEHIKRLMQKRKITIEEF